MINHEKLNFDIGILLQKTIYWQIMKITYVKILL